MTRLHNHPRSLGHLCGFAALLLAVVMALTMSPINTYAEENLDVSAEESAVELTEMATTDVQSISFTPVNPITLQEGTDYTKSGNSYELERSFLKDGDTLVLNTSSGSETYVIANATWDPIFKNPNKWGDELAVWAFGTNDTTGVDFSLNAANSTITVRYLTKTCSVPVTLIADPISSISYTRPTGVVLIEDWDSYHSTDWNGNQSPSIYLIDTREDDELTISYKDGTSKTYVYQNITLDDGSTTLLFANQEDTSDRIDVRNVEFTSDQSSSNYWGYGTHYFTVTAFQHTCTLEATTYPHFVQSISFTPKNSYVLTDADAYTETKRDEDWKKYDVTYYRSPEYVHGDKLTITTPSGTVLSYVYSPLLDGFSIAKNTALAANVPNLIDGNRVLMWDCSLAAEHYGIVPNWNFDLQYLDVHTSVPFEVTGRFRDVNENTPHYQDIYWLAATGITTGFEDNTYRGTNTVLRQDMAAFLFRIAKRKGMVGDEWLSEDWEPTREQLLRFDDVDESTPHFKEICWLAETGITTGYSDGTFRGSFTILRQDMAAFLFRLANLCGEVDDAWLADNWQPTAAQLRRFSDVNTSTPHFKEICWLAETGITTGYSDGTFRGYFTVLRQDMAAFLHRFDSL